MPEGHTSHLMARRRLCADSNTLASEVVQSGAFPSPPPWGGFAVMGAQN